MKAPTRSESIGGLFRVGDFPPGAIPQVSVSDFVRNYVMGKCFDRVNQSPLQYDCATSLPGPIARTRHPDSSSAPRNMIVDGDLKAGIIQQVRNNIRRDGGEDMDDPRQKDRFINHPLDVLAQGFKPEDSRRRGMIRPHASRLHYGLRSFARINGARNLAVSSPMTW